MNSTQGVEPNGTTQQSSLNISDRGPNSIESNLPFVRFQPKNHGFYEKNLTACKLYPNLVRSDLKVTGCKQTVHENFMNVTRLTISRAIYIEQPSPVERTCCISNGCQVKVVLTDKLKVKLEACNRDLTFSAQAYSFFKLEVPKI